MATLELKKTPPPKAPRHRSPNYPAIGLEEALKHGKTLLDQGGAKHFIPLRVAFDLWNYKSGAGSQIAAALKAYGLAVTQGKTDKREIKLTERARRILLDADNKQHLLQDAAINPTLHAELWKKYDGEIPQSDVVLKNYLVVDRGFNRSFVDKFISQFRGTLAFAGLSEGGTIVHEEDEETEESDDLDDKFETPMPEQAVKKGAKDEADTTPLKAQLPFPLYLSKTRKAILYVPATLTQKELDLLRRQIDHSLTVIEATILSDESETEN